LITTRVIVWIEMRSRELYRFYLPNLASGRQQCLHRSTCTLVARCNTILVVYLHVARSIVGMFKFIHRLLTRRRSALRVAYRQQPVRPVRRSNVISFFTWCLHV